MKNDIENHKNEPILMILALKEMGESYINIAKLSKISPERCKAIVKKYRRLKKEAEAHHASAKKT